MSRELGLAIRLLEASSPEVGKIIREELGHTALFAANLLKKADWDGPDICVHGARGTYTVEVCNEPFAILNAGIEDAPFHKLGSRTVHISTAKIRKLIEALGKRQHTLRRVAEAFLSFQTAVPETPSDRFEPVSVRRVAEGAALHESTVKKAVANKVIAIGGQRIQFDSLVTSVGPGP